MLLKLCLLCVFIAEVELTGSSSSFQKIATKVFLELNGSCLTPENKNGTARLFKDCPELYKHRSNATGEILELLKKSFLERRKDGKVVVCCENFEPPPPPKPCVNPDGNDGLCIFLRECPRLSQIARNLSSQTQQSVEFLRNSQCDFVNGKPLVCCVEESKTTTERPRWLSMLPQAPKCGTSPGLRLPDGRESVIDDHLWTVLLQYQKRQ